MKRIRHTKIDKPIATAATHHLTAATPSVGSSAVSGVMGGHHSAAAQAAAALFGLPAHQLSSLSALQGVSGASSSQFAAHHHMSTAAAAMSAASAAAAAALQQGEITCPCCKMKIPDRVSYTVTASPS